MIVYDYSGKPSSKEEYSDAEIENIKEVYRYRKSIKNAFDEALRKHEYLSERRMS